MSSSEAQRKARRRSGSGFTRASVTGVAECLPLRLPVSGDARAAAGGARHGGELPQHAAQPDRDAARRPVPRRRLLAAARVFSQPLPGTERDSSAATPSTLTSILHNCWQNHRCRFANASVHYFLDSISQHTFQTFHLKFL